MPSLNVRFALDNAAYRNPFSPELLEHPEVAASVRKIADQLAGGAEDGAIIDANGNHVGYWSIEYTAQEEADRE